MADSKKTKPFSEALGDQLARDIIDAATEAFGKTFDITILPGRHEIGEGGVALTGDVSGIVGFVQEKLEGTLTICFRISAIHQVLPRLLGKQVEITQAVAMDAVGEITNMVFGNIKTALNQRGYALRFGLPSVICGDGHFISQMHQGRYMLVHLMLEGTPFQIHIALHKDS